MGILVYSLDTGVVLFVLWCVWATIPSHPERLAKIRYSMGVGPRKGSAPDAPKSHD